MKTTKNEILKAALKLFLQNGVDKTSMNMLAGEVGISKPALYYHFENKKVLTESVLDLFDEEMGKWSAGFFSGVTSPKSALKCFFNAMVVFDDVTVILLGEQVPDQKFGFDEIISMLAKSSPTIRNHMNSNFKNSRKKIESILLNCQDLGLIKPEFDCALLALQVHSMIEGCCLLNNYDHNMDLGDISEQLFNQFWQQIRA